MLLNVANWVVFYNTEAFEKAGIAAPPTTWEEFIAACDALKAAGYTPFNGPTSGGWMPFIWFSQLVLGTSPDAFVGLTDGSVAYDGPEVQNAFKVWDEMYAKGYFTDPREQDDQKFFVDGTAAMFLVGDWHSGSFAAAGMEPGVDFKTFLMPSVSPDVQQSVIVEASPIVVSAAALAANPDLGKVVQAMMSDEASNSLGSLDPGLQRQPQGRGPQRDHRGQQGDGRRRQPACPGALVGSRAVADPGRPRRRHGRVHVQPDRRAGRQVDGDHAGDQRRLLGEQLVS